MSKRIDIKNDIYSDIYVLDFSEKRNTHAIWKCLCMRCNSLVYVSYINLVSGNTKSCAKCGQKKINYITELEILHRVLILEENKSAIARDLHIGRKVIYRVLKENIQRLRDGLY